MNLLRARFLLFALPFLCFPAVAQTIPAGEVVKRIQSNITSKWREKTVDTFKSGSRESKVTGIATTFLANLDVLKRAKARGLNMVITHEPTFYNHLDEKKRYGDDPVLKAKLKFIEENDMVIWRFHDHWHSTEPDGIYHGIAEKIGWSDQHQGEFIYKIPATTLAELTTQLKGIFGAKAIRVIGDPDMILTNAALCLGAPGSMTQIEVLRRSDVDVMIGGEAPEWETVEYVRDAISAGMNKGMIFLGHAISEEAGMEYCAVWLRTFISEVPVEFVPAGEPFWVPK